MSKNLLQRGLLELAGPAAHLSSYTSIDWSSIKFKGEKHQFCFEFDDDRSALTFTELVNAQSYIPFQHIEIPGMLLCSVIVVESTYEPDPITVSVEALTLND